MKKSVLKAISLVLVVGLLFSFCACTLEVNVHVTDKDGNSLSVGGDGGTVSVAAPTATDTTAAPPATTAAPDDNGTAGTTAASPSDSTTAAPADDKPASSTSSKPQTTAEIADFYKKAVERVKVNGEASYVKKEWQVVDSINIGPSLVNNAVIGVVGNFMTKEEDAADQIAEKGDSAKDLFPPFTLTDYSQIASATCEEKDGNYVIKIVMKDEDTPKKASNMLGQVTNSVLWWEDIDDTLKNDSTVSKILTSYDDIHVIYKGYLIEATIKPNGEFVSLDHIGDVDIQIGSAKILVATITNKSGHMVNYCKYSNFQY